jgi:type I restriction enzyme M protein
MLNTDTKRRIDTARDILVGKVPDPKSQVEQITIALIYKFMDDMDAEAEELGGKRKFFTGEFARYGWGKVMSSELGGHAMRDLYEEALKRMPENDKLPPLFRKILEDASLPYRDPETLKSFLKIINEFSYDHSERLGDAFEYLLSVLGSQGDAGQFRTPRHIIDFIVEILAPQKGETILDPACGTAGFLISAYKHILANNRINMDKQDGQDKSKSSCKSCSSMSISSLTPEEKGRLAQNFKGYDISPDMVRLSLVNLYLHGFTDPHIVEYDTITSEERWNEYADVILANPPFMSPKGGIKPHKRFSIQAKRSEVLFVDYMAEHLTPTGRAGIIVPEGIIFQSQTAYKELRKMLVENSLVAVISLPAGCFNPYSGVKTSILILDKSIARQSNSIAFFKVESDGYGLGAQRREIGKNDLPAVAEFLKKYLSNERQINHGIHGTHGKKQTETAPDFSSVYSVSSVVEKFLIVPKEKIAANGDYNLSGERYREGETKTHMFSLARIGDVCTVNPRKNQLNDLDPNTRISFVPMADLNEHRIAFQPNEEKRLSEVSASYTYFEDNDVLLAKVTPCFENGKAGIARGLLNGIGFGSSEFYVLRSSEQVFPEWIYFCVMHPIFRDVAIAQMTGTGGLQRVPRHYVENFQIPLPPLDVQKEIVSEIDGYQKVIDGARAVLEHYRPHIPIHPDWPVPIFSDAPFQIIDGDRGTNYPSKEDFSPTGHCLFLNTKNVRFDGFKFDALEFISAEKDNALRKGKLERGDVLLTTRGTIGNTALYDASVEFEHIRINSGMLIFRPDTDKLSSSYLFHFFQSKNFRSQREAIVSGAAQPQLPIRSLNEAKIPVPDITTQQAIVAEIEAEQALVAANRELIARLEKKIQATLARVWGEEEPAAPQP